MDMDAIRTRLAAIQDELIGLPNDAFERRAVLHEEQEALRAEAHAEYDAARSPQEIAEELHSLERRWEELQDMRIDVVEQAGGGGQGGDFGQTSEAQFINNAIDAGHGRAELEQRINRLRALLEEA